MQLGFAAQSAFAGRKDWHSLVDALPCRPRKRLLRKLLTEIFRLKHSLYYLWSENHCRIRLYSFLKLFHSLAILLKNISKFHRFCFRKASNELRCFSYPSNAMAPYTPFLSIEVDIVCLLSSFSIASLLQLVSPTGKSVPTSATPWHSELNFSVACRNCGRNSAEVS